MFCFFSFNVISYTKISFSGAVGFTTVSTPSNVDDLVSSDEASPVKTGQVEDKGAFSSVSFERIPEQKETVALKQT